MSFGGSGPCQGESEQKRREGIDNSELSGGRNHIVLIGNSSTERRGRKREEMGNRWAPDAALVRRKVAILRIEGGRHQTIRHATSVSKGEGFLGRD